MIFENIFSSMYNYMITKVLNACKWVISKLSLKDWVIIILLILCGYFYFSYRHYYHESLTPVVVYNTDSLEIYKDKLKNEYVAKDIYVQDVTNLLREKGQLAIEVQHLKDNPIVVTKTDVQVRIDTVKAESIEIAQNDSTYDLRWRAVEPNGYYDLSGTTNVHSDFSQFSTQIDSFKMNANITIDILDNGDKKLRMISRTDNPYINITNMDGVVFDPTDSKVLKRFYKQKRWSIGPYVGYGVTGTGKLQPSVGIGISYGIIQF